MSNNQLPVLDVRPGDLRSLALFEAPNRHKSLASNGVLTSEQFNRGFSILGDWNTEAA